MAKLNNLEVPDSFRTRIMQMYRAPVLVMDQSGHAVPTNDSVPVDVTHKAAEGLQLGDDPLLAWAASHGEKGQAPPDSDALPYAGFYAMRGGWDRDDAFLFFRSGPTASRTSTRAISRSCCAPGTRRCSSSRAPIRTTSPNGAASPSTRRRTAPSSSTTSGSTRARTSRRSRSRPATRG
ncbi:MAG: hypothetical protein WDO13_21935 [Verrucomicrobiota bacterium]